MSETFHSVVIDDDKPSAKIMEKLLREEGLSVTIISDPMTLHAVLPEIPTPRVVFLDLEMPHQDGYEVLDYLREQFGQRVCVVAYSVHLSEIRTVMDKGFNGFFGKPVNRAEFSKNLQLLLSGQSVWAIQ